MELKYSDRTIFDSDRYTIRLPRTDAEILALEDLLYECRAFSNPIFLLYKIEPSTVRAMFSGTRKSQTELGIRFGVYDKKGHSPEDQLCAGFCLQRKEDGFHYQSEPPEFKSDLRFLRFLKAYYHFQEEMKLHPMFSDEENSALLHAIGVAKSHRGKGIASLIFQASIEYARDGLECSYMEALMSTPETKHLGRKFGFEVALDNRYSSGLIAYALGLKEDWEGTYDLKRLD